jgi:hypothetical protein
LDAFKKNLAFVELGIRRQIGLDVAPANSQAVLSSCGCSANMSLKTPELGFVPDIVYKVFIPL